MNIIVNDHRLYLEDHGPPDGHPIVLLHHGLGSTLSWESQIPPLVQAGFRAIVYDRWGYGCSQDRRQLALPDFEDDLEDLAGIFHLLRVKKASLIGHSDGGTMALYFAAQHPHQISSLITMAAHIYIEPKMKIGIRGLRDAFEGSDSFRRALRRLHGERVSEVFYRWYGGWTALEQPPGQPWDLRGITAQIRCPALVVQGLEDEHAEPQHAEDIASGIPGAELWLVPGAGHMLPQERPMLFAQRVVSFLHKSVPKERFPGRSSDS